VAPVKSAVAADGLDLGRAGALDGAEVLAALNTSAAGLSGSEAARRLEAFGPNAVRTHRARIWTVLERQLRSPLLLLLLVTATVSFFVGDRTDALIISGILLLSIGLGFFNEYRASLAAEALHSQIRHKAIVRRAGTWSEHDVTDLVPGDIVQLGLGSVVPADVRLLDTTGLECGEAELTGETFPVAKSALPVSSGSGLADMSSCAFMGTVVRAGAGEGVVVATGPNTEFGRIALGLGEREPETEFQAGLRGFSGLLVRVALVLTGSIFVINVALSRPLIEALLFSLAIAVGITPQLLPAIVTTSLAAGSRQLARQRVLVKRLVCIEDLGNIEMLLTDKTGTLTEGRITFDRALDVAGRPSEDVFTLGLVCNEAAVEHGRAVGGNPLDVALWEAPRPRGPIGDYRRVATIPFDHERRMASVLVDASQCERTLVTKGAPEGVLERCRNVDPGARGVLDAEFDAGARVVAVASRPAPDLHSLTPADEHDLRLLGFLVFVDPAKSDAAASIARLNDLGVSMKVVTGDNPRVAEKVCADLGLPPGATVTGHDIEALDDDKLLAQLPKTTIFARVSPAQKARLIRVARRAGDDVAFLGDGVNDAVALHAADIGISVESATDVARDAADVVLLEKDLGVLADGVVEGRRIFANTVKYVLMGTSSNFGNMFSAAAASAFLSFLPMLPSQILLNNLLYDTSQLTIPTDRVDAEMLRRPAHWDIRLIRRFMLFFGPISSVFDFVTFGVMLGVFGAGPALFRSGWFVESLATQTLVIFVIRTRRHPFFHSRPSRPLLLASLGIVAVGAALPFTPMADVLGFTALPAAFFAVLVVMVAVYLTLVEYGKTWFFSHQPAPTPARRPPRERRARRVHRRAARWSHAAAVPG
jgi:Mg2+-importing ATPase